ncbi:MAG: hypothetical protein R3D27_10995 [Hyphomicrobiaceae bacterium]
MLKKAIYGLVATAMLATGAQAAVLNASGSVSVNTGSGFRPVSGSITVNPGDRVLVGPGGNAQITYSASCITTVSANRMAVVRATPPCTVTTGETVAPGANTGIIVGGALLAGGIAAAVIVSSGGSSNGASP